MKGEWCFFSERFSKEYCDYLIQTITSTIPAEQPKIGSQTVDKSKINNDYRRSDLRFFNKNDSRFQSFFDEMWKMAVVANDEWFGLHLSRLEFAQMAEYKSSELGEYKTHQDVFWVNGDPVYHRKLTAVVQLSEDSDYAGGDLVLDYVQESPDRHAIRKRGSVIFFPAVINHHVTQVTAGNRFSVACWFEGPKWR